MTIKNKKINIVKFFAHLFSEIQLDLIYYFNYK